MTNQEFQNLMQLKKVFIKDAIALPNNGENETYDLESTVTKDKFYLDVDRRGKIELSRFKLQNRYAVTRLPLVRIDIDSPPHLNLDGTKTTRNHIHIFKEMDHDTGNLPWAYDLESFEYIDFNKNKVDFLLIFSGFCEYCNICMDHVQGV